jgi:hypothetical protein
MTMSIGIGSTVCRRSRSSRLNRPRFDTVWRIDAGTFVSARAGVGKPEFAD